MISVRAVLLTECRMFARCGPPKPAGDAALMLVVLAALELMSCSTDEYDEYRGINN